ncbi:CAP domain-containing protein [Streptomyces sp. TP-A0356]|uniref:CAP domain-containing protein n=1 Tax=Streptomyces sp. TP-A0356 TaxID=1359208 RepID=UPI0006E32664|nr:CAP domain-containing protein [Streptomyces sp. TP-A0356]
MGKHRKETHYRRIVIAAVAIGTVGVPSVAVACADWRDSGRNQSYSGETYAAKGWWSDANWNHHWNGNEAGWPTSAASKTPTAPSSTPKTTTPKRETTAPSSTARTTTRKPRTTASPSTPKATASASATPTAARAPKASAPAAPTSPSTPKATATASGATARIVELVNAERSKVGCSPVTLNATLAKVAQAHSEDMASHQNMSHTGSDGSSPGDRITRAGYNWSTYGENVAYGYATPEKVMAGWMSSPGHKANILNCAFKEIGVGFAQPDNYWTQDFGTAQ